MSRNIHFIGAAFPLTINNMLRKLTMAGSAMQVQLSALANLIFALALTISKILEL